MGLRLINVINKNTKQEVCSSYNNTNVDTTKSNIKVGKPLKIVSIDGSFFTHEEVISIRKSDDIMTVETTRKIWNFTNYFSCKYCGNEMNLMKEDDILGFKEYSCSNEYCNTIYTIQGHQYDEGEWSKDE